MVTAEIAWGLADTTGGRFILGLGTQVKAHIERRYGMTFDHPGSRLREYVLVLRAIFRAFQGDAPLDFHGDYWRLNLLPPQWSPDRSRTRTCPCTSPRSGRGWPGWPARWRTGSTSIRSTRRATSKRSSCPRYARATAGAGRDASAGSPSCAR